MAAPLLVVLPSANGAGLERMGVAGLPLSRRVALAAGRAGFGDVVFDARDRTNLTATARRIVVVGAHVVPQSTWLRTLG